MPAGQFTIPTIFTAIDKFSLPIKGMSNALNGFVGRSERLLGRANAAFTKLLTPVTSLNRMLNGLGFYIGLYTLIRLLKGAIDVFADFQQAQVDIRAVTKNNIPQTKMLADQARELALRYGETATSILQTDLALIKMGYSADKAGKAAEAILTGSVALKADPEELAKSVAATMQAFKLPAGSEQTVVDMFAKVADISALDWKELQTMLPIAQGAAAITGHSLPEMLALFAAARDAQVHVASGSTAIKNMMIKSGIYDKDLTTMLQKITSSSNSIKTAFKMFGPKTLVTALPLAEAQKLGDIENTIERLKTESKGYAQFVANIRLGSFKGALKILGVSYDEFIFSIEDGNGPLAEALTKYAKVASAMLLISSDSKIALDALRKLNPEIVNSAEKWLFWLKFIGWVIIAIIALKALLFLFEGAVIALNIVVFAAKAAMWLWNIAIWNVNAALMANPIGLLIAAIFAMLLAVTLSIMYFDEWGAAALALWGPLGWLIILIKEFADNWSKITESFNTGGVLAGFKSIATVISISILKPLEQILRIINSITGIRSIGDAALFVKEYRNDLAEDAGIPKINPKANQDQGQDWENMYRYFSGGLTMNINDPGGHVKDVKSHTDFVHPRITPTSR